MSLGRPNQRTRIHRDLRFPLERTCRLPSESAPCPDNQPALRHRAAGTRKAVGYNGYARTVLGRSYLISIAFWSRVALV